MALVAATFFRVVVRFLDGSEETFERWDRREAGILAAFAASCSNVEFVSFDHVSTF